MYSKEKNKKDGEDGGMSILGAVLWGIIILLVLSYFGISVRGVAESPTGKDNFSYVGGGIKGLWHRYIAEPISNLAEEEHIQFFWQSFTRNMRQIRDGQPTDMQTSAPVLP